MIKRYSQEEIKWLKNNSQLYSRKELTELLNAKFNDNRTKSSVATYCKKHGFKACTDGRFKPGNRTWSTGLSSEEHRSHFTKESYSSMKKPLARYREKHKVGDRYMMKVGDVRIPYIIVSTDYRIPFKKRIIPETRYVLKQHGIEVPEGYSVLHLDGNILNNDISNLVVVSDYERLVITSNGWFGNKEITKTGLEYAKLRKLILDNENG